MTDTTIEPRDGERIDTDALRDWIAATVPELLPAGSRIGVRQFPAGFSNLTYRVSVESEHGTRALVLRRPPRGVKPGVAHDMGREHGILAALQPLGVPVPCPIARCDDPNVIGAPFYLMEHVDGVILRGAQALRVTPGSDESIDTLRSVSEAFVATLSALHAVDVTREPLRSLGRAGGYVERQVNGWTRRWEASRTSDVPALDRLAAWLDANRPAERAPTLVHNDFKFDNLVLDPLTLAGGSARVVAILDWEMATVGDPLMDLGTSLAYWVEAGDPAVLRSLGLGATALPGSMTRAEIAAAYGAATGHDVSNIAYYHAFGLFKVAVIAQQIYARHVQGLTGDQRFAGLDAVVAALGEEGERVAASGTP